MEPRHDLFELMQQMTSQMSAEYTRIRSRVREDPGSAGDQGEENWAELLRRWLPSGYHVVTKGRVITTSGKTSGQLDVFVLSPQYPHGLLHNKLYLAAGVLAAFECKNTLRPRDVRSTLLKVAKLNEMLREEGYSSDRQMVTGLLAHSSEMPVSHHNAHEPLKHPIGACLYGAGLEVVTNPFDYPDLICVANSGTWELMRGIVGETIDTGTLVTSYNGPVQLPERKQETHSEPAPNAFKYDIQPNAIGRFLALLLRELGDRDSTLKPMADYFHNVGLAGIGGGVMRGWKQEPDANGEFTWTDVPATQIH